MHLQLISYDIEVDRTRVDKKGSICTYMHDDALLTGQDKQALMAVCVLVLDCIPLSHNAVLETSNA